MRHPAAIAFLLSLVLIIPSCGGDDGSPSDTGDSETRVLEVSLESSGGAPASRIRIVGIPDDVDWAYGRVTVPGAATAAADEPAQEDDFDIAFIRRTDDGDMLLVPAHPTAPMQGGEVEIVVTNGSTITSNTLTLDVDGLTPAPGAFGDLVTKLELLLDAWAAHYGTSTAELRSTTADQLSAFELPLLLLHVVVNHPDNPNTMRAFADGDIPLFGDEDVDRDLLDAFAGMSGLADYLDGRLAFVDTLTLPETPALNTSAAGAMANSAAAMICFEGPTFDIGSNDCRRLAELMAHEAEVEHDANLATSKVTNLVTDVVLTAAGATRAAYVAWGIGNTLWASDTIDNGAQGVYPSQFVNDETDFGAGPLIFPEDFPEPGTWSDFQVTAVSKGWRFDDVIKEAYSRAKGAPDAFSQTAFDEVVAGEMKSRVEGKMQKTFKDPVWEKIKQDLGIDDLTKIEYCPQMWRGIDCTGLPFSKAESPSLSVDNENLEFEPTEVGKTTLRVGTTGIFGRVQPTAETKEIETQALEVSVDPFQAYAGVDEPVGFTAVVTGAYNEEIEWYTTGPLPGNVEYGPDWATVTTPSEKWDPAIVLHARSLSNTGLREGLVNSDPREDESPIEYESGSVVVTPSFKCLQPDEKQSFSAQVIGLDNQEVAWSYQGVGELDGNTYTAPSTAGGEALITATSVENPDLSGSAQVVIAACKCAWGAWITGHTSGTYSGDWAVWQSQQGTFGLIFNPSVEEGIPTITVNVMSPIEPGTTGTFDASYAYFFDGTIEGSYLGPWGEEAAPQVTITSNDGVTIEGTVTGVLGNDVGETDNLIFMNLGFKAAEITSNGGSPCSEF